MEELIIFTAPYEDGEPDSEPVVVSRNGVTYTIMRGVPTKIPRGVADILENAYKIRNLTPHLPVGGGFDCAGGEGIIPHIGANGNWYIGDVDTGKPSRGEKGTNGTNGNDVRNFGLIGDGTTDNSDALDALIAGNPAIALTFPEGVYCFSRPIAVTYVYWNLEKATFKFTGSTSQPYFIKVAGALDGLGGGETPINDMYIKGRGKIDCQKKIENAVLIGTQRNTKLSGLRICEFNGSGIRHTYNGQPSQYSYELNVDECEIYNEEVRNGTFGIYTAGDSYYSNIIIRNCKTAVKVMGGGNHFVNIHAWCYDFTYNNKNRLIGTKFAETRQGTTLWTSIYIDTYEKGFVAIGENGMRQSIVNCNWFTNTKTIPSSGYEPCLIVPYETGNAEYRLTNFFGPSQLGTERFLPDGVVTPYAEYTAICTNFKNAPVVGKKYVDNAISNLNLDGKIAALKQELEAYVDSMETGVQCEGLTVSTNSISGVIGGTVQLTVTRAPEGCTQVIRYFSTDESVATVENGLVTLVGSGECNIKITCGAVTKLVPVSVVWIKDKTCDGTAWTETTAYDIDTQVFEADFDLTGIAYDSKLLFGVGRSMTSWGSGSQILLYCLTGNKIRLQYVTAWGNSVYEIAKKDSLNLKIKTGGAYIDGVLKSGKETAVEGTVCEAFRNASLICGQPFGDLVTGCKINYIKVTDAPAESST